MVEGWRPVVGFEGQYDVSDLGRVRRCARLVDRSNGHAYRVAELVIAQVDSPRGYKYVGFKVARNTNRIFLVHRLVAQAFVANPNSYPDVNHIDLNKLNNAPANLEWCTKAYNTEHATVGGRFHGRSNPNARFKLQPEDVDIILSRLAAGDRQHAIADDYGVSQSLVSMIKCKRCWLAPPAEART